MQMAARRPAEHANERRFAERRNLRHGLDGPFAELGRGDRSDAPEALDREGVQEGQLAVGGNHQQSVGLRDPARDLGEELRPGNAHRDGEPQLLEDLPPEPDGDLGGRSRDPPQPADVEEGLVDRQPLDERRRVAEHLEERLAGFAVRVHARANDDGLRAEPASERAAHRRSDAERLRLVARREHDPGADDDRAAPQGGVVPLLDRGVEGVGVRVQDRRLIGHVRMLASRGDAPSGHAPAPPGTRGARSGMVPRVPRAVFGSIPWAEWLEGERCGSTGRAPGRRERRVRGGDVSGTDHERPQRVDGVFSAFASSVAKWTGSHWAFVVAAVLVIVSLLTMDVEETNLAISIVTLLMVLVLQNTQNRDSAALHLKLDEVVRAEPEARDEIRGAESRSAAEIGELTREDSDSLVPSSDEMPGE